MALFSPTSRAEITIPCEPSLVFELLTDYDTYSEWLPLISQSKLLAKEGDLALAEFEIAAPHPDKLVVECIHDKNRSVLGRVISGKLPLAKIEWTLSASGQQTAVTVALEGKPDWHWVLPAYRKLLVASGYAQALQGQAAAFSPELTITGGSGEVILDLMETGEGMMLVYRGQKYLLQAVSQGAK